ncbi:MAG: lasso peptide [Vicinamibacterales bacterium]|jgi:hypothetical protein|nr:lasso peptide [Vicinamibacterales bacterium]
MAERAAPAKKPYTKPQLTTYGDILEITQAVGYMGVSDGGTWFMSRTS